MAATLQIVRPVDPDYIDLGKDGSRWKHGYIPENPAAVALKDHKKPSYAELRAAAHKTAAEDLAKKARGAESVTKRKRVTEKAKATSAARKKAETGSIAKVKPRDKYAAAPTAGKRAKPEHQRFYEREHLNKLSDRALERHAEAHEAAAKRARTEASVAEHKHEAKTARLELARRQRSTIRKTVDYEKSDNQYGRMSIDDIEEKLKSGKISSTTRAGLLQEVANRHARAEAIVKEYAKAEKYIKTHNLDLTDPGKIFSAIYKLAPSLKPHLEKLRTGKTGRGFKEGLNLAETLKVALHGAIVPLVSSGVAMALMSTVGIKLGGG